MFDALRPPLTGPGPRSLIAAIAAVASLLAWGETIQLSYEQQAALLPIVLPDVEYGENVAGSKRCKGFLTIAARFLAPKTIVFEYTPDCPNAISPADFLPRLIGASTIRNANFVDPATHPGHLGSDLRFHTKSVLFDVEILNHVSLKNFVTRFHITEIQVRTHVGEQSQKTIPQRVPEVQYAM